MIQIDNKIFKELSKKYNIHPYIVQSICTYPFLFAKGVMENPDDHTPIMLAKLFKIKLKRMFEDNKKLPYVRTKSERIKEAKSKSKTT